MRLYKMQIVDIPDAAKMKVRGEWEQVENHYGRIWQDHYGIYIVQNPNWKPEGWKEHLEVLADHGRAWACDAIAAGYQFFWPKEDRIYRSRSSAQMKKELVESFGGKAVVLVAEVGEFIEVNEARKAREAERDLAKAEKLIEQANALLSKHEKNPDAPEHGASDD